MNRTTFAALIDISRMLDIQTVFDLLNASATTMQRPIKVGDPA